MLVHVCEFLYFYKLERMEEEVVNTRFELLSLGLVDVVCPYFIVCLYCSCVAEYS